SECNDFQPCTIDQCIAHACTYTPSTDLCPDDFLCYKSKLVKNSPKFLAHLNVPMTDDFETQNFDIKSLKLLCTPSNTGDGIVDPATHLAIYKLKLPKGSLPHAPRTRVKITNALGSLRFDTIKADL